jgi:hypothetical protein
MPLGMFPKRAKMHPVRFDLCLLCLFPAAVLAKTGLGVDVDFYTGPISNNVWQHLKATNQKFVIAQAWGGRSRNEFASSQLAGARLAGMKTAAYILLNYDNLVCPTFAHPVRNQRGTCFGDLIPQDQPGGRWQVRQGLAALGAELEKVSFIAIDVEWFATPEPSLNAQEQTRRAGYVLEAIDELKAIGKKIVIYTRNDTGHWSDITGCGVQSQASVCSALFRAINDPVTPVALWDVQNGTPILDNFRPHGAWTRRLGRQYRLDANSFGLPAGRTLDLNVFDLSLFSSEPAVRTR